MERIESGIFAGTGTKCSKRTGTMLSIVGILSAGVDRAPGQLRPIADRPSQKEIVVRFSRKSNWRRS
jgi:hypothetical protein